MSNLPDRIEDIDARLKELPKRHTDLQNHQRKRSSPYSEKCRRHRVTAAPCRSDERELVPSGI